LILSLVAVATWAIEAPLASANARAKPRTWTGCHGYPASLRLSEHGGLSCNVAYEALTDFYTSAASYDLGRTGRKGSTRFVSWSNWGDHYSYADYGLRWSCTSPYPYSTVTCMTSHARAMKFHSADVSPTRRCSGGQPPYSTDWSGYGPSALTGPFFTRNANCALAKQLEYSDAVIRAGGATAAYAAAMFNFPQGQHYALTAMNQKWQCGVWTKDNQVQTTIGDATYNELTYNWSCLSTDKTSLGEEVFWSVVEPHCQATGLYIQQPPPPPVCKP
jgi:hypothetical protein